MVLLVVERRHATQIIANKLRSANLMTIGHKTGDLGKQTAAWALTLRVTVVILASPTNRWTTAWLLELRNLGASARLPILVLLPLADIDAERAAVLPKSAL